MINLCFISLLWLWTVFKQLKLKITAKSISAFWCYWTPRHYILKKINSLLNYINKIHICADLCSTQARVTILDDNINYDIVSNFFYFYKNILCIILNIIFTNKLIKVERIGGILQTMMMNKIK